VLAKRAVLLKKIYNNFLFLFGEIMSKLNRLFIATLTLIFSTLSTAGTSVLNVEIGVSTVEQVRQALTKNTKVQDEGTNKFTNGTMLKTDGSSYEIEGLNSVLYIFDEQKKLAGIVMDMNKARFDSIYKFLSGKYKVSSQQLPFVGDKFARFKTTDTTIEINAPHLSFEMEVRYVRNDAMQKYNNQTAAEANAKKKSEASKF
jgi:hypothetical protein